MDPRLISLQEAILASSEKELAYRELLKSLDLSLVNLLEIAHDRNYSFELRALVLMLFGTYSEEAVSLELPFPVIDDDDAWLRRAYYFGLRYGMPHQPLVVSRMLAHDEGLSLSVTYVRESDAAPNFKIVESIGLKLMDDGLDAKALVSLARSLHAIELLSERLLDATEEIAMLPTGKEHTLVDETIEYRKELLARLSVLIGDYMIRAKSSKIIILVAGFINTMIISAPLTNRLIHTIEIALAEFLTLDDASLTEALKIEMDHDRGHVISSSKEVMQILERAALHVEE